MSPVNPVVSNILIVLNESITMADSTFAIHLEMDFVNRMLNVWALAKK